MLRYTVKLEEENIKREEIVWSEKYVSPDLSTISGVTSQKYHLGEDDFIAASIGSNTNFSRLNVSTTDVTRNGFIVVKGKEYRIMTAKTSTVTSSTIRYIEVNGVYYYVTGNTVTVHNHLTSDWSNPNKPKVIEGDVTGSVIDNKIVKLDTIFWIEDDKVTIDGNTYFFDRYDKSEYTGLKYYEEGRSLSAQEVTPCDGIMTNYFDNSSDYIYVTKFSLTKNDDKLIEYDRIGYCTYFYYVYFKDNYCPVRRVKDGDDYKYECYVPKRLIDDDYTGDEYSAITVSAEGDLPTRISQLKSCDAYIAINGVNFKVDYTLQNANTGDELAIYAIDDTHNIKTGDKLTLSYSDEGGTVFPVYTSGSPFVMYDNAKYPLEDNIADTVKINGVEYDISYPFGKTEGSNALVVVDDEEIPMKIINGGTKLERNGYIIVDGVNSATTQTYNIKSYSGVTIGGNVYRVTEYGDNGKCITPDMPMKNEFLVTSVVGSSLYICEPSLNNIEYSQDFIDEMAGYMCDMYAERDDVTISSKNRAFGIREITPSVAKTFLSGATSSNDFYNVFDDLTLFANSGYIQIDLPFTMNVANNTMQDDIVERDFFEAEKEKAINPIVDMEKDVYEPVFMDGTYSGSTTHFSDIRDIEVNLHFRTRDMSSWKVNDGNENVMVSGISDNWFCTDYYPYKQIISGSASGANIVMNSSDIVGLLYFDNDDVFYQKDNVAKSFLRFSYYDSPDPNTQSLMCTSTVFMNEHILYKNFVDNSRKNIDDYGMIQEQVIKIDDEGNIVIGEIDDEVSGSSVNRISVYSEYLGKHDPNRTSYVPDDVHIDESKRVSSKFVITNKYATDTSSEGFYLYIFREYSENLHPKPIYMKVEFNHAGIGRTIPFIVPMRWESGETESDNKVYPVSALTLSGDDLTYLKDGYPLTYVYAQTYIPLYAVYDFINKRYVYVFDDRYVTKDGDNVILNLFELKVMDENTASEKERGQVRNGNVERANININTRQFSDNI